MIKLATVIAGMILCVSSFGSEDTGVTSGQLMQESVSAENEKQKIEILISEFEVTAKKYGFASDEAIKAADSVMFFYKRNGLYEENIKFEENHVKEIVSETGNQSEKSIFSQNYLVKEYIYAGCLECAKKLNKKLIGILNENKDYKNLVFILENEGLINLANGDYEASVKSLDTALVLAKKVYGDSSPVFANLLLDLAKSHNVLSNYTLSNTLLEYAQLIFLDNEDITIRSSAVLVLMAKNYESLGDHQKSIDLLLNSLSLGGDDKNTSNDTKSEIYSLMSRAYLSLNKIDDAMRYNLMALEYSSKSHFSRWQAITNAAEIAIQLSDCNKAKEYNQIAFDLVNQDKRKWHSQIHENIQNSSFINLCLGNLISAKNDSHESIYYLAKIGLSKHDSMAKTLYLLSLISLAESDKYSAAFYAKEAVNILQLKRKHFSSDSGNLLTYSNSVSIVYKTLSGLLIERGDIYQASVVLDLLKESEYSDFVRGKEPDRLIKKIDYDNQEKDISNRLNELSTRIEILGAEEKYLRQFPSYRLTDIQKRRLETISVELADKHSELFSFISQLKSHLRSTNTLAVASQNTLAHVIDGQNILASLGAGAALLQFYVLQDKVGVLVSTSKGQIARESAINSKELDRKIFAFARALADRKSDLLPLSQELYKILVKPVEADLVKAGAKTVMLSLDGNLRFVPFGALHDGSQYMVERWSLPIYTSVMKQRLLEKPEKNWKVAGLGVTKQWDGFAPLPGVRRELMSIIKNGNGGVLPGQIYLDESFTQDRLKRVGREEMPVIHISSHFQFSPGTEENSFLLLGDGTRLTLGDIRTKDYRFDGVDMLTLSACETALGGGRDSQGREIEGFGVLAQKQGAKSVLATLWKIDDESTAGLMADLYRQRQANGLNKAAALRQAQLDLMKNPKYSHPYYWAPFVLMGNWR